MGFSLKIHGFRVPAALLIALGVAGCASNGTQAGKPAPLSPLQRAAMQTKELDGDFETAFAATISVLQDDGWQIDEVDKGSGLIQASSLKRQDLIGPGDDWRAADLDDQDPSAALWTRWERLTIHLEPWRSDTVRERISIVRCGALPSRSSRHSEPRWFGLGSKEQTVNEPGKEQSVIVEDPRVYQHLFQQIQKAIFIRQGLTGK